MRRRMTVEDKPAAGNTPEAARDDS
jgi:hypothetical protein